MNALTLIQKYYPVDSEAYRILVSHSEQVRDKALAIAKQHPAMHLDLDFIAQAAMLHDIGIYLTDAPTIDCHGTADYICHGYLGADLVRAAGYPKHALVCERHTGTGLSLATIQMRNLPIPHREMEPVSLEEQLICFADKFFSKTKLTTEKSEDKVRSSLSRYGAEAVSRFDSWCKLFLV
jgi:uncharacterized protein